MKKKSSTQTTIMINTSKSCIKNDAKKSSQYQLTKDYKHCNKDSYM